MNVAEDKFQLFTFLLLLFSSFKMFVMWFYVVDPAELQKQAVRIRSSMGHTCACQNRTMKFILLKF